HGIFSGGVGELVCEGLKDPGEGVAARGAESISGNSERHERRAKEKVWQKSAGKFATGNVGGRREFIAFAKADEVIAPGDKFAGSVEAARKVMKSSGAIVIVVKIVFASPEELDGDADFLGDGAGFEH